MIGPTVSKLERYRLLALLYASQFFPLGFVYYALTAVLRERGVPLQQLGALQLLALIWVISVVWAPAVDRYRWRRLGHYRGWLLVLQSLTVVAVLALVLCDVHGDLTPIFVLVVVIAVLSATQDIAADATAVVLLRPSERGLANGIQFAGGYLGFIIGGGGMLVIYDHLGWPAAVTALAVITALPIPFVLRYREPQLPSTPLEGRRDRRVSLRMLVGFFRRPGTVPWLLFVLPLNYIGIATAYKLITPLLVDSGWPLDSIGVVAGFGGGVVAMISALAAGAVLRTVPRRTALLAFGLIALAAIAALSMVLIGATLPVVVGAAVLVNVANASVGTAIFTVAMDYSRPELAGTDYTFQTSLAVLCSDVAGAAGLALAGHVGYATVITGSLILAISGLVATTSLLHARPVSPPPAPTPDLAPLG